MLNLCTNFEDRNFRLLGRFIFPDDSFRFNRQLSVKNRNFRVHRNNSEKVRKSNHVSVAEI